MRLLRPVLFLILTIPVGLRPEGLCHAQTDGSRFLRWAGQDAAGLGRVALQRAPAAAGAATAFIVGSSKVDPVLNDDIRAWSTGSVGRFLDGTNPLGGPRVAAPAVGIFGLSLLLGDERSQDAAFTSLEAVVYAGALAYGIKYSLGRGRPLDGFSASHFAPFSGNTSFPSGHTTTAFALITPWVLYYNTPLARSLFLLPVGTALARMDRDRHWATDVLAGGALGILTARYLVQRHTGRANSNRRSRVRVTPGGASLQFWF
ncbi:MAG: membrane-associated phospholipid phosphatase [Rhodothermales bacterium]|jgi:membrane-associated phospholipid phosphatase